MKHKYEGAEEKLYIHYRKEKGSIEIPHEEAEIQRKALRREKILAFSEDTSLEKERMRLKMTPRKVGV